MKKIMNFNRCSSTRLETTVSELLSALLKRLTDLERHEEELRSFHNTSTNTTTIAGINVPCSSNKKV